MFLYLDKTFKPGHTSPPNASTRKWESSIMYSKITEAKNVNVTVILLPPNRPVDTVSCGN